MKVINKRIALSKRELRNAQHRLRLFALRVAKLRRDGMDTSEAINVLARLKAATEIMRRNHEALIAEMKPHISPAGPPPRN